MSLKGGGSRPTEFTGYPDNLDALLVKYQTRVSHWWQPSRKVYLLAHDSTIRGKAWEVRSVVTGRKAEQSRSAPSLRMINGLSFIPFSQFFTFSNNTTTRGHSAKINNWTSEGFSFPKELLIAVTSYIRKTLLLLPWIPPRTVYTTAAKKSWDGLLHGLAGPSGPLASSVPEIRHRSRCSHTWYVTWYVISKYNIPNN